MGETYFVVLAGISVLRFVPLHSFQVPRNNIEDDDDGDDHNDVDDVDHDVQRDHEYDGVGGNSGGDAG